MSLNQWADRGWLSRHRATPDEIRNLLRGAERDLGVCRLPGQPADWVLGIAHNAALLLASAALAAEGWRASGPDHRYRTIASLAETVGLGDEQVATLQESRKQRNRAAYETPYLVSEHDALEIAAAADELRELVEGWLRENHPELRPAKD